MRKKRSSSSPIASKHRGRCRETAAVNDLDFSDGRGRGGNRFALEEPGAARCVERAAVHHHARPARPSSEPSGPTRRNPRSSSAASSRVTRFGRDDRVVVEKDEVFRAAIERVADADVVPAGPTAVHRVLNHPHPRVFRREQLAHRRLRAVIDQHDFRVRVIEVAERAEALVRVVGAVEVDDDDRDPRDGRCHGVAPGLSGVCRRGAAS